MEFDNEIFLYCFVFDKLSFVIFIECLYLKCFYLLFRFKGDKVYKVLLGLILDLNSK